MLLRKYISGGKVLAIREHGLERILIFDIGKGDLTYRLIIELFDEGNVILTDEAYRIIKPLRHHRFKDRDIVPDAIYTHERHRSAGSPENLTATLAGDDRDLVRALAIAGMLGGTYAEYVCRTAGIEKSTPDKKPIRERCLPRSRHFLTWAARLAEPVVSATSCEPVVLAAGSESTPEDKNRFSGFFRST